MLMLFPIIGVALVWIYVRQSERATQKRIEQMSDAILTPINEAIELQRQIYHDEKRRKQSQG